VFKGTSKPKLPPDVEEAYAKSSLQLAGCSICLRKQSTGVDFVTVCLFWENRVKARIFEGWGVLFYYLYDVKNLMRVRLGLTLEGSTCGKFP
jgi:hypothetical protein